MKNCVVLKCMSIVVFSLLSLLFAVGLVDVFESEVFFFLVFEL